MTPLRAVLPVLVLALAACSTDADPGAAGESPSGTPSATATATPPVTTPTPKPEATPLPTDLANGRHYAYLKAFDRTKLTLTVDVAQFLTGEAAEKAAREDGEEAFDYYIRNQNTKLRTLPVTATAKVVVNTLTASESGSSSKDVTITHAKLASFFTQGKAQQRLFWFTLKGGAVVEIREQYLP